MDAGSDASVIRPSERVGRFGEMVNAKLRADAQEAEKKEIRKSDMASELCTELYSAGAVDAMAAFSLYKEACKSEGIEPRVMEFLCALRMKTRANPATPGKTGSGEKGTGTEGNLICKSHE